MQSLEQESAVGLWKLGGYANGVCTQSAPSSMPALPSCAGSDCMRTTGQRIHVNADLDSDVTGELTAL